MSDHESWLGRALELVMRERAYHRGEFVDPCEVAFRDWEAALEPGYRFDYEEGQVVGTVEVERVDRRAPSCMRSSRARPSISSGGAPSTTPRSRPSLR